MIVEDGERVKPTKCAFCIPDITYNFWRVIILHYRSAKYTSTCPLKFIWARISFPYSHLHSRIVKMLRVLTNVRVRSAKKNKELNKLLIFFATKYDAPISREKKVFEAVFLSSIL